MSSQVITVIIVGAGDRSMVYANYALMYPERLKVVGVVEPDPLRRQMTAERFHIPSHYQFESVMQLVEIDCFANAVINGTLDHLHLETTIPLLEAGYDVLLEKPIGISQEEIDKLQEKADELNRKVVICHVLRYAPFYLDIMNRISQGDIGDIISIQTAEHVSFDHTAVSFVRGKWRSKAVCKSSMLMAKCCHDLDIINWLNSETKPKTVISRGSRSYFREERAPKGAGTRCVVDCAIEQSCIFSAKKHYIETDRWSHKVWPYDQWGVVPTYDEKIALLKLNDYGRCVWHCDNDVVDRESLVIEFKNGSVATHNMIAGTIRPCRTIYVVGTRGEIQGVLEDGCFTIRYPDLASPTFYREQKIDTGIVGDNHGGGDLRLVDDFVSVLQGQEPSISFTSLERSIYSHRIGFAAERSRENNIIVQIS